MAPLLSSALLRTQSDERLLALAADGHEHAFEAIVDRYRRPLLRYLRGFLAPDRAEDVLQAAFVSAWTSLRRGTAVRDLRPWLYRICHNGALNALARRGYDHGELDEALPGADCPAELLGHRDTVHATLASLAGLPDRQRAALLAVAVEGRPHGEVARELGLSDGALRQLVHRARATVRSAVSAVTPGPLLRWLLRLRGVAGAAKAAAVVATAGILAVAGLSHPRHHHARAAVASATPAARVAPPATEGAPRQVVARHHAAVTSHHPRPPAQAPAAMPVAPRAIQPAQAPVHRRSHRHAPATKLGHHRTSGQVPIAPATQPAPAPAATPPSDPAPTATTTTAPPPSTTAPCHEVACRPASENQTLIQSQSATP